MGISLNYAPLILRTLKRLERPRSIITLGRQDLDFGSAQIAPLLESAGFGMHSLPESDKLTQEQFFHALGFSVVHSLDVSNFEGANYVHDLKS